jgi:acyl-CoA reductase-like NAD-dependent aldehyde dehydrogenase
MATALLLVDLQYDFIERPGVLPSLDELGAPLQALLAHARAKGMPVLHVRTLVSPSGEDRMPHWKENGIRDCTAGTRGAETPPEFAARENEIVIHKQFFSGFGNPQLKAGLDAHGVDTLWIAGLYTQSCVRATAMDAYERGYRVTLVEDCLGSNDPLHARISLDYLHGRAARVAHSSELLGVKTSPMVHRSPARPSRTAAVVQPDSDGRIRAVCEKSHAAFSARQLRSLAQRRELLRRFRDQLVTAGEELVAMMAADLGKPRTAGREEMARAAGHVDHALELENKEPLGGGCQVVYEPHGAVAIVTPWNNPVAIAVGKLAAALLLGNAVVWKPAYQASNISLKILDLLHTSGMPRDLVQIVNGGPAQVETLARDNRIAAVSITGPEQAGRTLAPICLKAGKPLQAELGGNNAMLVTADADIPAWAPAWARMAFGFAGQRCTAIRRFVVERSVLAEFQAEMRRAMAELVIEDPEEETCTVGPLVSVDHHARVARAVTAAVERGASLLVGGLPAPAAAAGQYYPPTLLAGLDRDDPLVQEELFGPVAIVQPADDFEQGVELVNGVRQGLLAGIATRSAATYEQFARECDVGMVVDGCGVSIHPGAPFGGRKASQVGPPEHGVWDRVFFARVKTCYRSEDG